MIKGNPNWVKGGPSPNPSGRPKGAAAVAREILRRTNNLQDIVDMVEKHARCEDLPMADRKWAIEWLADRGIGKAQQVIQLDDRREIAVDVADDELAALEAEVASLEEELGADLSSASDRSVAVH